MFGEGCWDPIPSFKKQLRTLCGQRVAEEE